MGLDDLTEEITYDTRTVSICTKAHIAGQIEALERTLAEARSSSETLGGDPNTVVLVDELKALEAQAAEYVRTFTVTGVDGGAWRKLLADHAPERELALQGVEFDPATFPPAALAACLTHIDREPVDETAASCQAFTDKLSQGQWARLWRAVLDVNVRGGLSAPKISARYRNSPSFRAELDYCGERGIPHSVFLGRVVALDEALWLDDDREKALVWLEEQRHICPGCGHLRAESMDPETQGQWIAHPLRCHACKASSDAARQFGDGGSLAGLFFTTEVSRG